MVNLGVWRLDEAQGGEGIPRQPQSVARSSVGLEVRLEDWIEADATLIGAGLEIVGRQMRIDDGRLDLLAIDSQDRWVVIEIKSGLLDSGALTQALGYASSLARLPGQELQTKIDSRPKPPNSVAGASGRVRQLLESEGDQRDIAVLLVGVGLSPGLARMREFLGRFDVPISVVSFEVFALDAGPKLLIREVLQEPAETAARSRPRRGTVDTIRQQADGAGVVEQLDRFIRMSDQAGLVVRPFTVTVMIAPPANRARFLMYATVRRGGLEIATGPAGFVEFFPEVTEADATEALGSYRAEFLTGTQLDARLDQIEKFLTEKLPRTDDDR